MRLIDKALQENQEKKYGLLTEEYIKENYCPSWFSFAKGLKPYKARKDDPEFCLYNDSTKDCSKYCNECWNRTLVVG